MEAYLTQAVMQDRQRRWECAEVMAVRRHAGASDFFYLINTGPAVTATLRIFDAHYAQVHDVLAACDLPVDALLADQTGCRISVAIPAGMGCWLRCERDASPD
jgi:hypothetical protein